MKRQILRIIDANFNRSREGLRVCEDIVRFILNSPAMTKEIKSIRHRISKLIEESGSRAKEVYLESRDTDSDVGRPARIKIRSKRRDYIDIFLANIERVKESLRVLEEFFKLIDEKASRKFSILRFKIYDIEKKAVKRFSSLRNLR